MSIQNQIDRINGEVSTQTELIGQVIEALTDVVLSSSGSGSSGGASIETCTITVTNEAGCTICVCGTGFEDGSIYPVVATIEGAENAVITVLYGSHLCIYSDSGLLAREAETNCAVRMSFGESSYILHFEVSGTDSGYINIATGGTDPTCL